MDPNSKIYIAGHRGLVGSAIIRKLNTEGYGNLAVRTSAELEQGIKNVYQWYLQNAAEKERLSHP